MSTLGSDDRGVLVACSSCGRTNRLRYEHLARSIRCADCHAPLTRVSAPVDASSAAVFDGLLKHSPLPIVVDFWAPWCGPCRVMSPELEKLATMMAGDVLVVKVNTEAAPDLGERYHIRSIPTLAVFQGGHEVARRSGALPATAIRDFVTGAIAPGRRG